MKKIFAIILTLSTVLSLSVPALAAESPQENEDVFYTIVLSGQTLDLHDLSTAPYMAGNTVMVPLRKIAEALGYNVGWNAETGEITVEDTYTQKAFLSNKSTTVVFEGKLQIIDLSRTIENTIPTATHDGCTYVPLEFFQEFFNDTAIDGTVITIAPSMCEIQ